MPELSMPGTRTLFLSGGKLDQARSCDSHQPCRDPLGQQTPPPELVGDYGHSLEVSLARNSATAVDRLPGREFMRNMGRGCVVRV